MDKDIRTIEDIIDTNTKSLDSFILESIKKSADYKKLNKIFENNCEKAQINSLLELIYSTTEQGIENTDNITAKLGIIDSLIDDLEAEEFPVLEASGVYNHIIDGLYSIRTKFLDGYLYRIPVDIKIDPKKFEEKIYPSDPTLAEENIQDSIYETFKNDDVIVYKRGYNKLPWIRFELYSTQPNFDGISIKEKLENTNCDLINAYTISIIDIHTKKIL